MLAPEEIEFPFKKWTQFRDLEASGRRVLVDPQALRRPRPELALYRSRQLFPPGNWINGQPPPASPILIGGGDDEEDED